jgi:membrane protease YdiL (CAAX protease family)
MEQPMMSTKEMPPSSSGRTVWSRLPVELRAVLAGLAVTTLAITPWQVLGALNLRHPLWPYLPWCVPATGLWLYFFGRYLNGWGWPRRTAAARRRDFRARRLSGRVWLWSLLTGVGGWIATAGVFLATIRVVPTGAERVASLSRMPVSAVVLSVLMASVVAGFGEEAGFRGFLQSPLERRYGPVVAILVTGTIFGLGHASHSSWSIGHLPFYLVISTFLGAIAWRTGSILPCMPLHAALDPLYIAWMWRSDLPIVGGALWGSGIDAIFWRLCLMALLGGVATLAAFRRLGQVVDEEQRATEQGRVAAPAM